MAAITKFNKAVQALVEATSIKVVDDFVVALKEKFELDEEDLQSVIENFKKSSITVEKKKRPASEYNIFIKETIERLKKENPESKENLMKLATAEWNKQKEAKEQSSASESEKPSTSKAKTTKGKKGKKVESDNE